jgi:Dolichyl-phosphate-mannose-protein mannosyltransferase
LINDSTSSAGLPHSKGSCSWREILIVGALSAALACTAVAWVYSHGFTLYYGDAQAHLNGSRGIVDSRAPGYGQLGNVWLPMLNLLCLPFVHNNFLWSSGLAGAIPAGSCFALAATFFYLAAREAYGAKLPAAVTVACFALNPNMLYLAAIPMTEAIFFAGVSVQLFALLRFRNNQSMIYLIVAGLASIWASLTRYDGWFLIPFTALGFLLFARQNKTRVVLIFAVLASLAPLYWLAHNWWEAGDALDFYRGPYSAKGIYERGLAEGHPRDPVDHHFAVAARYYLDAGRLCAGWPLLLLGAAGIFAAIAKRKYAAILFLALTPCFYVWSMYSTGQPIHVPNLSPFSYYNTRYALALLPLCAFGAGALVLTLPPKAIWMAGALPLIAVLPWLIYPSHENWICWKESEYNSISRRFWTAELAKFFQKNYQTGEGILYSDGDVAGVFCRAGIPLSETLHPGDGLGWLVNNYHPGLLKTCQWAVVVEADRDPLARPMDNANWRKTIYQVVLEIHTKDDPVVRVYRRAW